MLKEINWSEDRSYRSGSESEYFKNVKLIPV